LPYILIEVFVYTLKLILINPIFMKTFKTLSLFILSLLLLTLYSCSNDTSHLGSPNQNNTNDSASPNQQDNMAHISIKLVDGPGDYDQVFVDIADVMLKMNDDSDSEGGWQSVSTNSGIYDLLQLTGGQNAVLVDDYEVLSGELSQIRLVLGNENSVVKDGQPYDLKTPSAQQSGLKVKVNQTVEAGYLYAFVLDFDVSKSIVDAGHSDNIILKPVITASLEAASGIIQGVVSPSGSFPSEVSVMVDGESITSYANDENGGAFALYGVPAGTYDLTITPDPSTNYIPQTMSVDVTNGEITDVGTIELQQYGTITGAISNGESPIAGVTVSVMVGTDEIMADTDDSGVFLLEKIIPATYDVTITPDPSSNYIGQTMSVDVASGETVDLGTIVLEQYGSITGTILKADDSVVSATVSVMVGTDEVSATTDDLGVFLLENIPPGMYTVKIKPNDTTLTFNDINGEVTSGETWNLGTINPNP